MLPRSPAIGFERVQGEWRFYLVIPSAYRIGYWIGQTRVAWTPGKTRLALICLSAFLLSDSAFRPALPGWMTSLTPGAWGNLTIRRQGDLNIKYITARLGQTPLEIVPVSFYRRGPACRQAGPRTASIAEIARSFSQETQREVVGAVNGGFFDMKTGLPIGFLLRDGMIDFYNMPQGVRRSMVGFTRPNAGGLGASILVESPEKMPRAWLDRLNPRTGQRTDSFAIHHVNVPGGRNALTLYTPRFSDSLRTDSGARYFVARQSSPARDGQSPVYEIMNSFDDKTPTLQIDSKAIVIALHGDSKALGRQMHVGDFVQPRWDGPQEWRRRDVVHGLLAGPRLLEKGKVRITAEEENLARLRSRDRVALGVRPDGEAVLVWLHHENRLANVSFEEVAKVLSDMGATEAIALDGGGSRAIMAVARDSYRKDRYLFTGRPVANALIVSLPANRT